jgi:hypothetical protein
MFSSLVCGSEWYEVHVTLDLRHTRLLLVLYMDKRGGGVQFSATNCRTMP